MTLDEQLKDVAVCGQKPSCFAPTGCGFWRRGYSVRPLSRSGRRFASFLESSGTAQTEDTNGRSYSFLSTSSDDRNGGEGGPS